MPENRLNYFVWNAQAIKIGTQTAPCSMPAVPLWIASITLKPVIRFRVLFVVWQTT